MGKLCENSGESKGLIQWVLKLEDNKEITLRVGLESHFSNKLYEMFIGVTQFLNGLL